MHMSIMPSAKAHRRILIEDASRAHICSYADSGGAMLTDATDVADARGWQSPHKETIEGERAGVLSISLGVRIGRQFQWRRMYK